jgi:hypothetical protein
MTSQRLLDAFIDKVRGFEMQISLNDDGSAVLKPLHNL